LSVSQATTSCDRARCRAPRQAGSPCPGRGSLATRPAWTYAQSGFSLVELRGLEPLTPTLPGAGSCSNQARLAANGRVGGVAGAATVVVVVVKTVVRFGANSATLNASSYRAICADDRTRQGWRSKRLSGGLCRRTASGEVSSRLRGTAGVDNLRPPEPRPEESEDGRHDE
jgi:hypothetical protein